MNIDNDYAWSTHAPLLKALIKIVSPDTIVELGLGMHSTPIFLKSEAKKIFFIENDKEWLEHSKKDFVFDHRCEVHYHDLGENILLGTKRRELTQDQQKSIQEYYQQLQEKIKGSGLKLLFVDNFACARAIAINTLTHSFDIVVYHDCQPKGVKWYEYYFEKPIYERFNNYVLKTPTAWTGCFINKNLNIEELLFNDIKSFNNEYCIEHGLEKTSLELVKMSQ